MCEGFLDERNKHPHNSCDGSLPQRVPTTAFGTPYCAAFLPLPARKVGNFPMARRRKKERKKKRKKRKRKRKKEEKRGKRKRKKERKEEKKGTKK